MNEIGKEKAQKVVSRNVAITLAIICVILGGVLSGSIYNYTSIIGSKDSQIQTLIGQNSQLKNYLEGNITSYSSQTSVLQAKVGDLQNQIAQKELQITNLQNGISEKDKTIAEKNREISELKSQITSLQSEINMLNSTYRDCLEAYSDLKQRYDNLTESIEKGKAVAESATWLSEDGRLKVKSELIPEYLFGEVSSYTIRVNVTNVGNEPLHIVLIFLFPYKDGKLVEYWSPLKYSKSVESLYIGESYSYNFTLVPKEITSYKVLAVAG
jgi:prefoldin subunit 5